MILAIETSSPTASLALWDRTRGKAIYEEAFSTDRAHNSVIFGVAENLLEKCDRKLSGIAVGLGPGSYSGVRVGIALANGLGLAMEVDTVGVSSLLAYGPADSELTKYAVIGDARRKTRFIAVVGNGRLEKQPELIPESDFQRRLNEVLEETEIGAVFTPDQKVEREVSSSQLSHPRASMIAQVGADKFMDRSSDDQIKLEPHYLRPPYITTPKKRRV